MVDTANGLTIESAMAYLWPSEPMMHVHVGRLSPLSPIFRLSYVCLLRVWKLSHASLGHRPAGRSLPDKRRPPPTLLTPGGSVRLESSCRGEKRRLLLLPVPLQGLFPGDEAACGDGAPCLAAPLAFKGGAAPCLRAAASAFASTVSRSSSSDASRRQPSRILARSSSTRS